MPLKKGPNLTEINKLRKFTILKNGFSNLEKLQNEKIPKFLT